MVFTNYLIKVVAKTCPIMSLLVDHIFYKNDSLIAHIYDRWLIFNSVLFFSAGELLPCLLPPPYFL